MAGAPSVLSLLRCASSRFKFKDLSRTENSSSSILLLRYCCRPGPVGCMTLAVMTPALPGPGVPSTSDADDTTTTDEARRRRGSNDHSLGGAAASCRLTLGFANDQRLKLAAASSCLVLVHAPEAALCCKRQHERLPDEQGCGPLATLRSAASSAPPRGWPPGTSTQSRRHFAHTWWCQSCAWYHLLRRSGCPRAHRLVRSRAATSAHVDALQCSFGSKHGLGSAFGAARGREWRARSVSVRAKLRLRAFKPTGSSRAAA